MKFFEDVMTKKTVYCSMLHARMIKRVAFGKIVAFIRNIQYVVMLFIGLNA